VLREDLQARLHQLSAVRPGFALSQRSANSEPVLQAGNKFGQSGSVEFDLEDVARKAVWATGWTLLSQGHTCPISEFEQPVMHHLDRMLQLEHVPDALVLCDRAAPAQVEVLGCLCLGPGAFSSPGRLPKSVSQTCGPPYARSAPGQRGHLLWSTGGESFTSALPTPRASS
jgi:hypothetical protein